MHCGAMGADSEDWIKEQERARLPSAHIPASSASENPDSPKEATMRRTTTTGPVAMYLSELSEGSRRTMRFALATAAKFFGDRGGDPDTFPWHKSGWTASRRCAPTPPHASPPTPPTRS
jgi:hypothetical protein